MRKEKEGEKGTATELARKERKKKKKKRGESVQGSNSNHPWNQLRTSGTCKYVSQGGHIFSKRDCLSCKTLTIFFIDHDP